MAKAIKLKNDLYLDSTGIVHNKELLSNVLNDLLPYTVKSSDKSALEAKTYAEGTYTSSSARVRFELGDIVVMVLGFYYASGADKMSLVFPYDATGLQFLGAWFTNYFNSSVALCWSYSNVSATGLDCYGRTPTGAKAGGNQCQALFLFRKTT